MNFMQKIDPLIKGQYWKYSNSILYVRKLAWIPMVKFKNDHLNIFVSKRFIRETIKLIKLFRGERFYLVSTLISDPKTKKIFKEDIDSINIDTYLNNYLTYYYPFKKINFDIISNMISYCKKEDCFDLVKPIYDNLNDYVQKLHYDWNTYSYSVYKYDESIRGDFSSLYRRIVLKNILDNS